MTFWQLLRALAMTRSFYAVIGGGLLVSVLAAPLIERSTWFLVLLAALYGIIFQIYLGGWMRRHQNSSNSAQQGPPGAD
jgi:hypothetical protein